MPELPEVETIRRDLAPVLAGRRIVRAAVHDRRLRYGVPPGLERRLRGATVRSVDRRAKFLLLGFDAGTLLVHLGMSGRIWIARAGEPRARHDHFEFETDAGTVIRLRDPRRFGALLWQPRAAPPHRLLAQLGPEPLSDAFDGAYLYRATRGRGIAIKQALMDARLVAGVGNIYASEALHEAGIHPKLPARRLGQARCARLAAAVRRTLERAIRAGGSTLRDYVSGAGEAGRFQHDFRVYGRTGLPCAACGSPIRLIRQGQRSTWYCPRCQRN